MDFPTGPAFSVRRTSPVKSVYTKTGGLSWGFQEFCFFYTTAHLFLFILLGILSSRTTEKVLSHLAEKEKIGGAAHGDTSPHHHTTYHFGLEVFAVIVANGTHLFDNSVYIQNHFHHTYLLIINSWVDFFFDFWLANVIYCES